MKKEDFINQIREESKSMLKKKAPTKPDTQFVKGALFAWDLLMSAHDRIYYEEVLRSEVMNRLGLSEPEPWMESLISDLADQMVERDEETAEIRARGRSWEKQDKNLNIYYEASPHINLKKEAVRSIGILREHLGLTFKATPSKINEPVKKGGDNASKFQSALRRLGNMENN